MICVFDIETIPDIALLKKLYPHHDNLSDLKLCEHAFEAQKEKTASQFLPLYLHQVVAISSVIADDYGRFIKVGNFGKGDDEKTLLQDFLSYMDRTNPKLVSFNGRNFDLVVMMLRAMRYNLCATAYYETNNEQYNKNKWENYRQRYSERFHTDLLDCLGNFGSVRSLKLDDICCMLNIPGKYDMSGDLVHSIYYDEAMQHDQKLQIIQNYCQSDVLNTYWVYLKYELLKGMMTKEDYLSILQDFLQKLPQDKPYTEVFSQALKEELQHG